MNKIKVFVVDDHQMFRDGVQVLLTNSSDIEVIGAASNGKECIEHLPLEVDVILMDISMPEMNGIETTQALMKKDPTIKIIALSMFGDEEYYYKMIHSGVKGFILKESGSKELEEGIREVHSGRNYFSQELLRNIIFNLGDKKSTSGKAQSTINQFTNREMDILQQVCSGLSNKEIAEQLNISVRTVESHKSNLIQKTGVKNTIGLVMYAIKNAIIKLS